MISNCWATDANLDKVIVLVTNAAKQIGGAEVTISWSDNPEVKEIAGFIADKRIGTLMKIINELADNEKTIFPNIKTNSDQLAATIIMRIYSFDYLNELISSTDNDVIVKDYLDSEIADLKMVLSHKISYGLYVKSQEARNNKREMLLFSQEKILTEYMNLPNKEDNIAKAVENKTSIVALTDVCQTNPDLCKKL